MLDASVVLAIVLGELTPDEAGLRLAGSGVSAVDLSEAVAERAGLLRDATRRSGLSRGDRACLALAGEPNRPTATADKAWAKLDAGIEIEPIR